MCGFYQFIPDAHFAGKTKFNYSITDCAQSITKNAQVIVTVHGIPRVNNLILNVAQGKRIAGSLQELVSGGCPPYTFVKVYESKECGLTIHEDGSYECVADCDFAGTAECGYMVVDAHSLQSAPATITLQIEGNPRIKDIHLEVAQAHELAGSLAPLVTGGNPPYSWIKLGQNKDGVFTLNADGTFSFKPNPDFFGTTSCRYMAIDAKGHKTVPGKIVITVNEEPRLAKLSQEIAQGQALIGSLTPLVIAGFPPYVFQKIEEPADGNLMLNECGTYQFVPRRDFAGKTTFNYTVTDIKNSVSKPSLVTVTVHDKPRIANKRVEMIKGEEIFGSLAALVEGGHKPYTFQKVGEPENGSLQISSDGSFKFIPNPEFAGNAVCYYAVIDGKKAQSAPGTLEITVHEKLHVSPERVTVAQGETLAGSLKKLLPVNEQLFTFQKVAGPHSGSLIINADGSYQFIPEQDFVGTTEFSYSAVDAKKITGIEGSVIITVLEKPQILNADKEICQGNLLRGALTQCVAGGYPPYTFKKVSESPDGTVMIDPCGTYQFVPAEQFAGTTEFAYAVTDMKNSVSKTGHVSVTVNERPRVGNTAFEICQGQELSGSLCALVTGGTPPYRFQKVAGSRENPLVIHPDGSYECHPDAHFVGRIKGSYVAIDAKGSRSTQGSILLTVNEQPRAGTIQLTTAQGEQLTGSLQGLVQGGQPPYRFQKIDESECGSLIINPDGSYQFNPHNDFFGTVALKYCAVDARKVKSCEGTMVVTVYQKPCAISEEREISEGQMLVGSLTPSVMGGYPPYSFKKMGEPQDGTLFINSCGAYQFMPAQNFAGKTVFNYSVTDIKQSLSNTGEVHITVHGRPVAKNAAFEINQGEQITGSLQDLVIGGNPPYTFVKEGDSKENNFVVERDGSYRCFPSGDFAGKIECNYRVVDAKQALSMPATITLVVHEKPHVKNADQTLSQGDTCVGSLRELVSGGTAPYIFEKVEDPGTGTFVLNSDGSYTFTPRQDFVGTTVFKYVAIDARKLLSNQAAIVMVVNEKPITRDSVAEISQGQMLVGSLTPSVMGGFPPYTFHKMGEPKEGTLFINSCGTYQFMPAADFAGTTAFNFSVTDIKKSVSKTSQVQVKVHQRPQVNDTKFTVPKGSEVIGSLLEVTTAGTPPYTFEKVGNSVNGNKIALSGDGIYHFGPDAQFVGNTEINFVAIDANKARSLPGKLIISVDLK